MSRYIQSGCGAVPARKKLQAKNYGKNRMALSARMPLRRIYCRPHERNRVDPVSTDSCRDSLKGTGVIKVRIRFAWFYASAQAPSSSAAQLSSTHLTAAISDGVTRPLSAFSSSIARIDAAPSIRSVERTIASMDSLGRVFNGVPFIGRPFLGARHRGKEASGHEERGIHLSCHAVGKCTPNTQNGRCPSVRYLAYEYSISVTVSL